MSIQSNFPAVKPTLLLDFANVKQLDPRITFTRASTATYYGTQTAKAEENLLTYSQEFENSVWTNINTTETANTSTAPDGTTTADTITDNATSGGHFVYATFSGTASTNYAFSAFVKAGTNNYACLTIRDGAVADRWVSVVADLSAGTISQTGSAVSATLVSSTITNFGSGWYRVQLVGSFSAISAAQVLIGLAPAASGNTFTGFGAISYVGTGTTILAWGAQLEQRSAVTAYTATTTQPITNYVPVLETAASGVARFDTNPVTDESLGLLIEESRTNLLTYSEQFQTTWTNEQSSEQLNVIISPAGTVTGDKLVEDTATSSHLILQGVSSLASGSTLSFSVYVKAAERTSVRLQINDGASLANAVLANYDVSTGVASSTQSIGTFTSASSTITPVGNGWYRCSISGVATGVTAVQCRIFLISSGSNSYTGNGYSGIYIWGAQLEVGAFATSYIPTVASQVTRAADAASMTGTNFSSWYNAAQGSLYAEASSYKSSGSAPIFVLQVAGGNDRHQLALYTSTAATVVGGVTQTSIGTNTVATAKNAYAYKADDFAAVSNAGTVATDTSGVVPTSLAYSTIGRFDFGGAAVLSGTIKKIAYYPLRVTNTQLQALTS